MLHLIEIFVKKIEFNCIREIIISNQNISMKSDININSKFNRREKILSVILEVTGEGTTSTNISPLKFLVSYEGIFKINTSHDLNDEAMEIISKVKAPQIIFPFILETIQNLTTKAGIKPMILPYIDFEKIYFENKNSSTERIIN